MPQKKKSNGKSGALATTLQKGAVSTYPSMFSLSHCLTIHYALWAHPTEILNSKKPDMIYGNIASQFSLWKMAPYYLNQRHSMFILFS